MKKLLVFLLAVLLLTACTSGETDNRITPTTVPTEAPTAPSTLPPAPVTVYPGAVEHYLGWRKGADFSWPRPGPPEIIMLHFCSAVVNHRDDPFNMTYIRQIFIDADVSIHYIIDREGTVYCYVPEDRAAWHAGTGMWGDDKYTGSMNLYSIGIELVGIGSQSDMKSYLSAKAYKALDPSWYGFTDAQYTALKALVEDICQRNNIPMDRQHIIGHEEYNPKKHDPGQLFDWNRLLG